MNSLLEGLSDEPIYRALSAWSANSDPEDLVAALVFFVAIVLLRRPLATAGTKLLKKLLESLSIEMSDVVINEVEEALRVILVTGAAVFTLQSIQLPEFFGGVVSKILVSILVVAVFSAWYRLLGPLIAFLGPKTMADARIDTSWVTRMGQFVVILLTVTAVLKVWNIDISTVLTGVGVFGAGLAIAAQDFVRNLLAGMSNVSEERFKVGDWIAVDNGVEGIVAAIDVRSTKIMGFDRVPLYVPNADLSNAVVLNKSRMDHRRILWTVPLVLSTTDEQIDAVCASILTHLRESGDFVDDGSATMVVSLTGFSENAVEIMVLAFTKTREYQPFLEVSARATNAVRRAVARAGATFAYPTRTIIVNDANHQHPSHGRAATGPTERDPSTP